MTIEPTVEAQLNYLTAKLTQTGIDNPRRQAAELLCDVLNCRLTDLFVARSAELSKFSVEEIQARLTRRLNGEPLAYIHGEVDFYGCRLIVSPAVLIPRQETELLVDRIVQVLDALDLKGTVLWDVCCGSGCIGIALKKHFPALRVVLTDQSAEALAVARLNAKKNGVEVECREGDLLAPFAGQKSHFFVCNPPYIAESEYNLLEREVRAFEPREALVGGETGLEIYRRLAHDLPTHLHPQAKVWLEIGYQQGEEIRQLFDASYWKKQQVEKDWAGHPRFFFLEIE